MSPSQAELDNLPRSRVGPYVIIRRIGRGGMAIVYEAEDERLGHRVALKKLCEHVAARDGARARFLREGRAAARVRHPHVVQVFALCEDHQTSYLAMELLEGESLGTRLARIGRLTVTDALDIALPVIAGVAAAHDAGVVHRDLTPSNIFLTTAPSGRPWPKIVDFGVSKVVGGRDGSESTSPGVLLGTAGYVAPEQMCAVRDVSFPADQFTLAVVLYQCLTGELPFSGHGINGLLRSVMTAPVVPPSRRAPSVPGALDRVILRAMDRDPRMRFSSVRVFGSALIAFASEYGRVAYGAELAGPPASSPLARNADGGEDGDRATTPTTLLQSTARRARQPSAWSLVGALGESVRSFVNVLSMRSTRRASHSMPRPGSPRASRW